MKKFQATKQQLLSLVYLAVACLAAMLTGTATSSSAQALSRTPEAVAQYNCSPFWCGGHNWACYLLGDPICPVCKSNNLCNMS